MSFPCLEVAKWNLGDTGEKLLGLVTVGALDCPGPLGACRLEFLSFQFHLKVQIQPYLLQGVSPKLLSEISSHFSWFVHGELDTL